MRRAGPSAGRSSTAVMRTPAFRNASSRSRSSIVSNWKLTSSNTSASGKKEIVVPVSSSAAMSRTASTSPVSCPRENVWRYTRRSPL